MAPKQQAASMFMPKSKPKKQVPAIGLLKRPDDVRTQRPEFIANFDDREAKPIASQPTKTEKPPVLYEGNFDEWLPKLKATLVLLGHWSLSLDPIPVQSTPDAIRFIENHVRPELLARIPQWSSKSVDLLLAALRQVATPFRLMDMPAELRAKVYDYAMLPKEPVLILFRAEPSTKESKEVSLCGKGFRDQPPSLTKVSRETREETMPLYFARNDFRMIVNIANRRIFEVTEVVKWARANKRWTKHLRSVSVFFQSCYGRALLHTYIEHGIEVTFKTGEGITARLGDGEDLEPFANDRYNEGPHVQQIEQYRSYYGLEGEAIPMLFTTDVTVWDELKNTV